MLDGIQQQRHYEPKRPKIRLRLWLGIVMLVLLAGGIWIGSKAVSVAQKIFEDKNGNFSIRKLFIAGNRIPGEENGEVRILLLGIGGEKHEGGTLSDTMILATFKLPQSNSEQVRLGLMSFPRDLEVLVEGYGYQRINTAYAYGESGGQQNGSALAIKTLERVIGKKIPYYAVADFQGFKKIIDDLGDVEITVDQTFTDAFYPDEKFGYLAPLTFEAGRQKMDGARALQYVRSRHGNNGEGTDFARSRRQQKVLAAIRDKILNMRVLTNLGLIDQLLGTVADHLRTNLEPYELKELYDLAKGIKEQDIISTGLDTESGILCDQILEETGQYVLLPCRGLEDYSQIRKLLDDQFTTGAVAAERAVVEIQNASGIEFLGKRAQNYLGTSFKEIAAGNYRGGAVYQESTVYDNTRGKKPATLDYLKKRLGSRVASSPFPFTTLLESPDFVIILSSDLQNKLP